MINQICLKKAAKAVNSECKIDAFLLVLSVADQWGTWGKERIQPVFFSWTISRRSPGFQLAVYLCAAGMMNNYHGQQLRSADDGSADSEGPAWRDTNWSWVLITTLLFIFSPDVQLSASQTWCAVTCQSATNQIKNMDFFFCFFLPEPYTVSLLWGSQHGSERMCVCEYLFIPRWCADWWKKLLPLTAGTVYLLRRREMCEMPRFTQKKCKWNPASETQTHKD